MPRGEHGLQRWRRRWHNAGMATIPLAGGSKVPVCDAWNVTSPWQQWQDVGDSFRGNIGVRCGNGLAVIDCDDPTTTQNINNWLTGQGLLEKVSFVKTPSGGQHVYININGVPSNFNWAKMTSEVGPGELRARNAYVAAPCSFVNEQRYKFTAGSPEKIASQCIVQWQDVIWVVTPRDYDVSNLSTVPVRLVRRDMPAAAVRLLEALPSAPKGKPISKYATRSEAEAAVISMLILAGWTFEEIYNEFEKWEPGHYAEAGKRGYKYLNRTYINTLQHIASTPERAQLTEAYKIAETMPWPGRGGGLERSVTLALLAHAWQFSAFEVCASIRDLAQHATAGTGSVHNALKRLKQNYSLDCAQYNTKTTGTRWNLQRLKTRITEHKSHNVALGGFVEGVQVAGEGAAGADRKAGASAEEGLAAPRAESRYRAQVVGDTWKVCEVWKPGKLSRSGYAVYAVLDDTPKPVKELAEKTGKHPGTIRRALDRLSGYDLAECVGSRLWVRGAGDLGNAAEELEAEKEARFRRLKHEIVREAWEIRVIESISG